MKTSFQLVADMNVAFGNPAGDPKNTQWDRLRSQCVNILSEYKELLEALDEKDLDGVRDALCDIHVFAYGAHHMLGMNADEDMEEVVSAVLTRFCATPEELHATRAKYDKLKVLYYIEGAFPRVRLKSAIDQGEEYPQHKFLKSASYRQPNFKQP